ncbi:hypothetical protein Pd630_LPD10106 (plasmid) [Rhodococcus opacus PD630]|nr:hypothetical protein Pd630_LPD10106 [Rhodococcus opacus PD630]
MGFVREVRWRGLSLLETDCRHRLAIDHGSAVEVKPADISDNLPVTAEKDPPSTGTAETKPPLPGTAVDNQRVKDKRNPVAKWWRALTNTTKCVIIALPIVTFIVGYILGRAFQVPLPEVFWRIVSQPAATLVTGALALAAGGLAWKTGTQKRIQDEEHHRSDRCWERLAWVIDKGSNETPGDTGIGHDLRMSLLDEIDKEARTLDDKGLQVSVLKYIFEVAEAFAATDLRN